jgi:hypothetical protein
LNFGELQKDADEKIWESLFLEFRIKAGRLGGL